MANTDCVNCPHKGDGKDWCGFYAHKPGLIDKYTCPNKSKPSLNQLKAEAK